MHALAQLEQFARERHRARKAAGATTSQNYGTAAVVGGEQFRGMINDTVALSQWMRFGVHVVAVDPGTSRIAVRNWENVRWQHRPAALEGDPAFDATVRPSNRDVAIDPQQHVMEMSLGRRAQRRARAQLNVDLQRTDEEGFATAFGNNMARAIVRGDTTSADNSINGFDGLHRRAQQQGRTFSLHQSVGGVQVAQAFNPNDVFWRALRLLPQALRSRRLRWYGNDDLWIQWGQWLSNVGTNERQRDDAAANALLKGTAAAPLGKPRLSIPDWPADEGPTAAANSAVDDGDGTLTIGVANVLPNANNYAGRAVRVTYTPTGQFEDLLVVRSGATNVVETAGSLGQNAAAPLDVVAANYTTRVIDETSIVLADPAGILVPIENEVEVYRDFDIRGLTHDTIAHAWLDMRLLRPDAVVFINGFYLPAVF